jgi:hypothetical protein
MQRTYAPGALLPVSNRSQPGPGALCKASAAAYGRAMRFLRLPSPAMAVALIALFVALGGTGYAVTKINGNSLTNRSVAAKKLKRDQVGGAEVNESKLGQVPSAKLADSAAKANRATSADSADVAASANTAVNAQTAANAGHATTADTATNATKLGGVDAGKLNLAATHGVSSCSGGDLFATSCVLVSLDLPGTSSVLAIASGGWYGTGTLSTGTCNLISSSGAGSSSVNMGDGTTNVHSSSSNSGAWALNAIFTGVAAGSQDFSVTCSDDGNDVTITNPRITAVRLGS